MKKTYFLMLLALVFFLSGCRSEIENISAERDTDHGKSRNISLEQLTAVMGNSFTGKISVPNKLSKNSLSDFIIDPEKIVQIDHSSSYTSISMAVKPVQEDKDYGFYNLIIEKENGTIHKTIYKYIPDMDWAIKYRNNETEPYKGKYSWSIRKQLL